MGVRLESELKTIEAPGVRACLTSSKKIFLSDPCIHWLCFVHSDSRTLFSFMLFVSTLRPKSALRQRLLISPVGISSLHRPWVVVHDEGFVELRKIWAS